LRVFGSQPAAELHKRTAGEIVLIIVDIQGIAPPDVEAEGVEGLLIA
jgi:hypothetical protein